tara:strand:- start:65 stop:355 length:291 start_codon:yes stop_codon:yes gene_type:complete
MGTLSSLPLRFLLSENLRIHDVFCVVVLRREDDEANDDDDDDDDDDDEEEYFREYSVEEKGKDFQTRKTTTHQKHTQRFSAKSASQIIISNHHLFY